MTRCPAYRPVPNDPTGESSVLCNAPIFDGEEFCEECRELMEAA